MTDHVHDHGRGVLAQLAPEGRELKALIPGVYDGFAQLHSAAFAEGAVDKKTKELLALAIAIAISGIAASIAVYAKGKFKVIEPAILADAWRYDSAVSSMIGGPGYKSFDGVASFDAVVVDGVVNGAGIEVRRISGVLSKLQTGLVRSYAAIVAFGAVAVLAWFLLRGVL